MRESVEIATMLKLFTLTLLLFVISTECKVTPIPVDVWKCCRLGEGLQRVEGLEKGFQCAPGPGATKMWVPLIYAPKRKVYIPDGVPLSHWNVKEKQMPTCNYPMMATMLKSTTTLTEYVLFANGSLWLQETKMMLPPTSFCIDKDAAVACIEREDETPVDSMRSDMALIKKNIRVKKCCGDSAAYNGQCIPYQSSPNIVPEDFKLEGNDGDNGTFGVYIVSGLPTFPECNQSDGGLAIAGLLKDSSLLSDGSLKLGSSGLSFSKGGYCVERVIENDYAISVFACVPEGNPQISDHSLPHDDIRLKLFPVCLLISTAFLLATLAAGFLLPSSHHALHWRCQTHYIGCLLVADFTLAVTQLAGSALKGTPCLVLASFMHFFFLAAFFWLNTMCFNIWWTFRDFRPTSLEKRQEVCRLRVYEVFAWGGPFLIAGVAALLDHLPADPLSSFLRPRFGEQRCWFYGDMEIFTFFFGPIGILLFVNLVLFASTARQLTCGLWKREDVKSTTERAALGRVCMKLVVVMGVTWVADVISWAVGGPSYVWYITDLINGLQGVLIFIVIGCQPQVWAAVKKFWCLKKLRSNVTNTTGAPMHSSSQGLPSMGESVTNNTIANTNISNARIPMETVC